MPRSIYGRTSACGGLAAALIFLAGCVPAGRLAAVSAKHIRPAGQLRAGRWLWPANSGHAANNPAAVTTHYFDPNVMPAGAVGNVPPGAGQMPVPSNAPYEGPASPAGPPPSAPAGPPPGYAGPAASSPTVVAPVSDGPKKSDDDDEWDISHLAPDYTWKKFKKAIGWGPDEKLAKAAYDKGQALFREKKYEDGGQGVLHGFLALARLDDGRRCHVPHGRVVLFLRPLRQGAGFLHNLLKQHDNTRYLDTVAARLFAIGTYWEQLDLQTHHWPLTPNATDKTQPTFDTIGNALACYSMVWIHDPTGPLADAALFRVANAHFRRGEWEEAADHYDMLRKNHPKSKYQKDAHLLELQAKLRIYQGPLYSSCR